jgi:hypothetical protein
MWIINAINLTRGSSQPSLQVLQELLRSSVGPCLSNESVCEIVQSCFRICFERNGTELLRRSAEGVLTEMVCVLFQRLQTLHKCSVLSSDDNMSMLLSRETMQQSNPICMEYGHSYEFLALLKFLFSSSVFIK